ncbi:MAG: hypothetical protein KDI41_09595, partial [Pseudomonadales bacterium]|nr:hypothetical protein [Pseudomonadales bacterium]
LVNLSVRIYDERNIPSTWSYALRRFSLREVTTMCGRFVQHQGISDYLEVLAPDRIVVSGYDNQPIGRYNVAPGTRVSILHSVGFVSR